MYGRRHQRKRSFKRVVVTLLTFVMLISVCFPGLQARAEGEDEIVLSETAQNYYDQLKELRSAMAGKSASDPDYQYAFAQFVLLSDKINAASATGSISQAEAEYLSDIINSALPSPEVNQPEQSEENTSEESKTEEEKSEETQTEKPDNQESAAETTKATDPAQDADVLALYEYMMSIDDIDTYWSFIASMTEEQNALYDQFTDEQFEALWAHIERLSANTEIVYASPTSYTGTLDFTKTANLRKDGNYNLELTLSGSMGTKENPALVDLIIVIDRSKSMNNESRLANVKSAAKTLINALEKNNAVEARYNVIDFAGTAWPYSYNVDRTGWVNSSSAINHIDNNLYIDPNNVDICTNYEAAFQEVNTQLGNARTTAMTVVVFMTDGKPTVRNTYIYDGYLFGYGTGDENSDNVERCMTVALGVLKNIPMNRFYVVGTGTADQSTLNRIAAAALSAEEKYAMYTSSSGLESTFADIAANLQKIFYSNVTITDTLNHHDDGKLMVDVTDVSTVAVTVYNGSDVIAGPAQEVVLAKTENNEKATLTASYNSTTGVLQLDFPDDYKLEPTYKYVLSAVIAPTERAYQEYRKNSNSYTDEGDANTGTHSGKSGFYSNDQAIVTYTYEGAGGQEAYDYPVVQLDPGKLVITKEIEGVDASSLKDLSFDVTITYPNETTETKSIKLDDFTLENGIYSYELTVYSLGATYKVEEKNASLDGYKVVTTVNGASGVTAEGKVGKGKDATVAYKNIYTPAVTDVTVTKTVTGNMGDWSKDFSFTAELSSGYTFKNVTYVITKTDGTTESYTVDKEESSISFSLRHGWKVVFKGVPVDATLTITEKDEAAYTESAVISDGGYEDGNNAGNVVSYKLGEKASQVDFTNKNDVSVDTGITLDTLPYVLILVSVVLMGAFLILRRRRSYED